MSEQLFASTEAAQLAYVAETAFNTTPDTPTMRKMRVTAYGLNPEKRVITSREIRSDAMLSGSAVVGRSTSGNFDYELSMGGDFDDMFQAILRGTYQVNLDVNTVAAAAPNSFSKSGAFGNVQVGQYIYASGFAQGGNTGWHRVTAKTNDTVTVASTITTEVASVNTIVRGKHLRNGTVRRSFSLELAHLDIGAFFKYRGSRLGSLSMNIEAEQIIRGSGNWMGMFVEGQGVTFAGGYTNPTTAPIITASENVGSLLVNGVPIGVPLRTVNFNVNNNLRNQTAIGEEYPVGIAYGAQEITGRLEAYFADRSLFDLALAHTDLGLTIPLRYDGGRGIHVAFPRIKLGAPQSPVTGNNADVMQAFDFQAFPDATTGTYQVQMDVAHA